jgi:antitoxin component YwqK of YwqJK toxin-antitoxin module
MRPLIIILLYLLVACTSSSPRIETKEDDHDNWRNTYPNAADTSFYHHEAFYPDGKPLHHVDFVNGQRNGLFQEWDSSGVLIKEGYYADGQRDGVWRIFEHGRLTQRSYSRGALSGPTYEELEDGRVVHGQYYAGKESGLWIWVRGISIDQTAIFKDGKYEGVMIGFWPNGVKQIEAIYSSDSLTSEILYWDSIGRPSDKESVGFTFAQ